MSRSRLPDPYTPRNELIIRLHEVTELLVQSHTELADLKAAELTSRLEAYMTAGNHLDKDTIAGRDRYADVATLNIATDIIQLRGQMEAWREERDWLTGHLTEIDRQATTNPPLPTPTYREFRQ